MEKNNDYTNTIDLVTPITREESLLYVTELFNAVTEYRQTIDGLLESERKDRVAMLETLKNTFNKGFDSITTAITKNTEEQKQLRIAITNGIDKLLATNKVKPIDIDSIVDALKQLTIAFGNFQPQVSNPNVYRSPIFYSTYDSAKQKLWLQKVAGEMAKLYLDENKNIGNIFKELYSFIRTRGYNVEDLHKEYAKNINKKAGIMEMCADSDILRSAVEMYFNLNAHERYVKKVKGNQKKKYTFAESHTAPESVKNIVKKLGLNQNKVGSWTYRKAFGLLGIDLDDYMNKIKKKYGLKSCSLSFAISLDPKIMKNLEMAVDNYLSNK